MKKQFLKIGIVTAIALAVLTVIYKSALTPQQIEAMKADEYQVDWNSVKDDPAEKLKFTMLIGSSGSENSWIQQMLEKRFNIEIKPIFLGPAAYTYAKPLMMAGGEIPDVLIEPDPIMLQRDVFHGFLLEIPHEVILKHAPNYVKVLNEVDPVGWLYANWNGKNYGIPNCFASFRWSVPGIWRMDWLRNLGIDKVPETLDEMHDALYKMTYNDPDGNGIRDTWGMTGDISNWWWATFADIFGAYGVIPFDWMERDGKAVWGGTLPETKEALKTLNQWYREGIIHPDFVTDKTSETVDRKFMNGVTGYIYYQGRYSAFDPEKTNSLLNTMKKLQPGSELVCGYFPIGPKGEQGGRVWAGGHVISFGKHMKKRPEVIIRILKMFDAIVSDEQLYLESHFGKKGVHWEFIDPELGPAGGTVPIAPYSDPNVSKRELLGGFENAPLAPVCGPLWLVDKYTPEKDLAFSKKYRKPEWVMQDVLGKPDSIPSASEYLSDLRNYQMTTFAEIIIGEKPVDYFDTFVQQWYARGGEKMTEEATALLKSKKEIFRKVGYRK